MKRVMFTSVTAVLLAVAAPARADVEIPAAEGIQYPDEGPAFVGVTCLDSTPIVTSEATFDAPHVTLYTRQSTLAEATSEDPAFWEASQPVDDGPQPLVGRGELVAMCM